jgi:hypothetical protein
MSETINSLKQMSSTPPQRKTTAPQPAQQQQGLVVTPIYGRDLPRLPDDYPWDPQGPAYGTVGRG